MSIKSKVLGAAATIVVFIGVSAGATVMSAEAATTQCGAGCIRVYSPIFGQNFIESARHGEAKVGETTILGGASSSNPAGDFKPMKLGSGHVSDFYAAGMVSSDVNSHYGGLPALQLQYAPFGSLTGLCSGVAKTAFQNEGLSLQPCSDPGTTVWIIDPMVAPASDHAGDFGIINGSTTDFTAPFAMTYLHEPPARISLDHLEFSTDGSVAETQLWNKALGPAS